MCIKSSNIKTVKMLPGRRLLCLLCTGLMVITTRCSASSHNHRYSECNGSVPLGLVTGEIEDWQITASSTYPSAWDPGCDKSYGRLYQKDGRAWCAQFKSQSEWLQVDLGVPAKITGIMIQGRGDRKEWVTSFLVSYSNDEYNQHYVKDAYGNSRVFDGNKDSFQVRHLVFVSAIVARYVRVHPVEWHKHPSMRIELLGCQVCRSLVARLPYVRFSASSQLAYHSAEDCSPAQGYIHSSGGWCATHNNDQQWLQIDLGPPTLITGVVTRGRSSLQVRQWVTSFRLSYSNDSTSWYHYNDKTTEFTANSDRDTEEKHYLKKPFVARMVRFHPTNWHHHISMRAGVLGCPQSAGECLSGYMRVNEGSECVEDLAYNKPSWVLNAPQLKRDTRFSDNNDHQYVVATGPRTDDVTSCTALDSNDSPDPMWMVDLGHTHKVAGVIILTGYNNHTASTSLETQTMYNLNKLVVYIDDNGGEQPVDIPYNMCGFVSKLHNALLKPRLHVPCLRPIKGRYVYVQAYGVQHPWRQYFRAVICDVRVYE